MFSLKRLLIVSAIILTVLIAGTTYYFDMRRMDAISREVEIREAELREKRRVVSGFRERVEFYRTREGMEHLAREQYDLVLPGERMIHLRSADAPRSGSIMQQ